MEDLIQKMVDMNKDKPLAEVKIRYGIALLRNEIYKLIILFCFFVCIGYLKPFLFSLIILLPIRIYSGGLHMKSNPGCFFFSFFFMLLAVYILPQIPLKETIFYITGAAAYLVIAVFSPYSSPKKPITSSRQFRFFRIMSILFTSIAMIIICIIYFFGYIYMAEVGLWTIFLQAFQLAIAHTLRKRRKEHV